MIWYNIIAAGRLVTSHHRQARARAFRAKVQSCDFQKSLVMLLVMLLTQTTCYYTSEKINKQGLLWNIFLWGTFLLFLFEYAMYKLGFPAII